MASSMRGSTACEKFGTGMNCDPPNRVSTSMGMGHSQKNSDISTEPRPGWLVSVKASPRSTTLRLARTPILANWADTAAATFFCTDSSSTR